MLKGIIKEIVEYFSLDIWDWFAVSIALISFIVAVLSFRVAKKTLKSQKQTEKNTMPIINMKIQEFLLSQLILRLLDAYIKLAALWNLMSEKNYDYYPSEHILEKLKIEVNMIHPELFYDNHDSYKLIDGFVDMIKNYNVNLDVLNRHLKNNNISKNMLNSELSSCIQANNHLAESWIKIMYLLFDYKNGQIKEILNPFMNKIESVPKENIKFKYIGEEKEVYLSFIDDNIDRKKFMIFLNKETEEHIMEFSQFIIKK